MASRHPFLCPLAANSQLEPITGQPKQKGASGWTRLLYKPMPLTGSGNGHSGGEFAIQLGNLE
ncbi:hypothetical protein [Aeromonas veronii]|uniref:hypothetical protein n=1 Tax=Aeromonas veronii TaxID=654 RepID=UPI003B9FBF0C